MSDVNHRYLYHVCPKCGAVIETEVVRQKMKNSVKGLKVYCWNHEEKIQADFVTGSNQRQKRNRDYIKQMGDVYVDILRTQYDAVRGGGAVVYCPICLSGFDVEDDVIQEDGDHGTTEVAVNCPECDFASPVRIRGLFE